jgi:hypothetical protein
MFRPDQVIIMAVEAQKETSCISLQLAFCGLIYLSYSLITTLFIIIIIIIIIIINCNWVDPRWQWLFYKIQNMPLR